MHWVQQNWLLVLGWGLYLISDAMPFLPGKAQGVAQFLLNVGRTIAKGGGKVPPAVALLLIGALGFSGCAQYSACVKAQVGPTLKADSATKVEAQVNALLDLGLSQQWIALGLQAVNDACQDTNCKALVSCAVTAWQQAHPASTKPAAKAAAAFLEHADVQCGARLAMLDICDSGTTDGATTCREVAVDDQMPVEMP